MKGKYKCLELVCGIEFDTPLQYPSGVWSILGPTLDCPNCGSSKVEKRNGNEEKET